MGAGAEGGARGTQDPAGSRCAPLAGEDSPPADGNCSKAGQLGNCKLLALVGNPETPSPGHPCRGSCTGMQVRVPTPRWVHTGEASAPAPPQLHHGSGLPAGTAPPQSGHISFPHLPLRPGRRQPSPPVPKAHPPLPGAGSERSVITGCKMWCHGVRHQQPQAGHQPRGCPLSSPDQKSSHHGMTRHQDTASGKT